MNFTCESVREKDASGQLIKAGTVWTERRMWVWTLWTIVAGCGFAFALIASPSIFLTKFHAGAVGFVGGSALAGLLGMWAAETLDGRERSLIFHADGRIELPHGHPWYRNLYELRLPQDGIVSIEAHRSEHPNAGGFDVRIYFDNGDIAFAAMNLPSLDAHKVAVMLMNALIALRDSQANPNVRRAA